MADQRGISGAPAEKTLAAHTLPNSIGSAEVSHSSGLGFFVHQHVGGPGSAGPSEATMPAKRTRKERGPNWSSEEVAALMEAKRLLFIKEAAMDDARALMIPNASKWLKISVAMNNCNQSTTIRDDPACKSKWNQLIPEYKKIADFLARTGNNEMSYWHLSDKDRKNEGLPKQFAQDVFGRIHDWYATRPSIKPPHSCDFLSVDDSIYKTPRVAAEEMHQLLDSDGSQEDPIGVSFATASTEENSTSTQSSMMVVGSQKAHALMGIGVSHFREFSPSAARGSIPPGVTPHLLSSSDTADDTGDRWKKNTRVRRKSLSGHSLIAEATRTTGDVMATEMRSMAESNRNMEKAHMDIQLQLFTKQMQYQGDRDQRLYENSRLANDKAKLAIEKQSEVVQCLAQLSAVLIGGVRPPPISRTTIACLTSDVLIPMTAGGARNEVVPPLDDPSAIDSML